MRADVEVNKIGAGADVAMLCICGEIHLDEVPFWVHSTGMDICDEEETILIGIDGSSEGIWVVEPG